jgi:putative ABC transport system permease protein
VSALPLRFAMREIRGGLRGFGIFLACIALGVAAIAGVGSVARGMTDGIEREGRTILGGDLAFDLVQRQATADERAFLERSGAVSEVAKLRAMARKPDGSGQALVELKAVDGAYPLAGSVGIEGGTTLASLLQADRSIFGGVADPDLLARLGLSVGDIIDVGKAKVRLAGIIDKEPDRLAGGFSFGPRLLVSAAALDAAGLVQPGSLVTWAYRLRLPGKADDASVAAVAASAAQTFPNAGWQVRTRDDAAPRLERNIERFSIFLTLIGLTTLVVGGVGVGNAVASYLEGKRDVIATLKCLGARANFAVVVYLIQILAIAATAILLGLVVGAVIPFVADIFLSRVLPVRIGGVYSAELATAAVYGFATALAFGILPLGRAREISGAALFRDQVAPVRARPRFVYLAVAGLALLLLAGLAIGLSYDRFIASVFAVALVASFLLLRLVAAGIMWLARHAPRVHSAEFRLAIGNIHRPGALTPAVVLSLGLGLALIVTVVLVDGNFRRDLIGSIPQNAPSFFFLDLPSSETDRFGAFVVQTAPSSELETVPMLRGRITEVAGVPAGQVAADPDVRWALDGDRGVTFASQLPTSSKLVEGSWWAADYDGPPLVSIETEVGHGIGLKLGDSITVNVRGREVTATVANFRSVEWQSLSINFVMVFSPNTFRGAPFSNIATLAFADGGTLDEEMTLLKQVTDAFPAVTAVRIKEAVETANGIVERIGWGVRGASAVTLLSSMLVLGGAFAAGRRQRIHDAVVLKMLGATRGRLIGAFGLEFLMLGIATAIFGLVAGTLAAWLVLANVMEIDFVFLPGPALGAAAAALLVTVCLGLASTWRALGQKAAPVLRNL